MDSLPKMRWTGSALALLCAQLAVAAAFQGSTVQQWRTCGGVHALRCAAENRKERTEAGCTGQFVDAVIPKPMGLVLEENHPSIQVAGAPGASVYDSVWSCFSPACVPRLPAIWWACQERE